MLPFFAHQNVVITIAETTDVSQPSAVAASSAPVHQDSYERQVVVDGPPDNALGMETGNRARETMFDERDSTPISFTLQRVDGTILGHLRDMQLYVEDDNKRIKIPIEYANAERWKQVRKDGYLRDGTGRIQTPIILFRRTAMAKHSYTSPVNQFLDRTYQTGWNRYNSYDKFAALNRITPSRETISVKIPDYHNITYEFLVWTDYVSQMNEALEQISYETDQYWGQRNDFKFYVRVDDYTTETDVPAEGDRIVKTAFSMLVRAYLLPETTYDTDRGHISTSEKRFTYKKAMNIIEVDLTNSGRGGTHGALTAAGINEGFQTSTSKTADVQALTSASLGL